MTLHVRRTALGTTQVWPIDANESSDSDGSDTDDDTLVRGRNDSIHHTFTHTTHTTQSYPYF